MTVRERLIVLGALVLSVLAHALVGYLVMNVPIGRAQTVMFDPREPGRVEAPLRVTRAPRDLIVEEEPAGESGGDAGERERQAGMDAEALRRSSADLLSRLDPGEVAPEAGPMPEAGSAAGAERPKLEGPAMPEDGAPGPGRVVDASSDLMQGAQPAVSLPRYVGATDAVEPVAPAEGAIDPAEAISDAELAALEGVLGGGGSGDGGSASSSASGDPAGASGAAGGGGSGGEQRPGGGGEGRTPRTSPLALLPDEGALGGSGPLPEATVEPDLAAVLPEPADLGDVLSSGGAGSGGDELPPIHLDRDFDYTLYTVDELPPRQKPKGLFGLLGFGDDEEPETEPPGWFEVRIRPRRSLRRLEALKKDVIWVIDTSGSIRERWVGPVRSGVGMALDTLNEGDRFNIVTFKEAVNVFSTEGPVAASGENVERAREFLDGAESSGYTDVNRALGRLIVRDVPPDRVYQVVLISDGRPTRGAVDARQIINMITRENDLVASIYCVGVGGQINRKLLEFLAYRNKGEVVYPEGVEKAAGRIRELAGKLRYPLLKDVTFNAAGLDTSTIYPRIPRDVYQGQMLSLFGRHTDEAEKISMRLRGTNRGREHDFTFTLNFDRARRGDPELPRDWAFWKLHHLYSEQIIRGDSERIRREIERLREVYELEEAY